MLGCFQVLLVTAKGRVGGTGGTGGLLPTVPADCCRICCYLPVVACLPETSWRWLLQGLLLARVFALFVICFMCVHLPWRCVA